MRDHDRVRYVRRRPSPRRSHSYERRRPKSRQQDGNSRRRRPGTPPEDSDDDTVYKVDQYGRRRYRRSSRERPSSRHGRAGREDDAYMSGALYPDPEASPDCSPSITDAKIIREERPGLWATIAGPFKISVDCSQGCQKADQEYCRCSKCHRGRPGSRHDRHHRRSSRSSRSRSSSVRTATPKSRSPGPRGILRRNSSKESSRQRLRKSVSFDSGTKIPHDYEEPTGRRSHDRTARTASPDRAYENLDPPELLEPEAAASPEEFQEAYTQQAKAAAADMAPELPTEIESQDSDAHDSCPHSHGSRSSKCRYCHHCPGNERPSKRDRKKPRTQTWGPQAATLSKQEEQLKSVAHSILLSTHQSWCGGRCGDLSKFVRQRGGCSACGQRSPGVRRTGRGRSIPHCRTLIHCQRLGHGIFPTERFGISAKSMIDRALRLAYADVYCCSVGGYVTPEEYLAYRRSGADDLDIGIWLHSGSVGEHSALAQEVYKTTTIWSRIMERARQDGKVCKEETVLQVLEDMART